MGLRALGSLVICGLSLSAATITVSPATTNTTVGTSISVDVLVASITHLYAHQFDLSFNPAVLSATLVSAGSFLSGGVGFISGIIDNLAGTVQFTADTLSGPVPGVSGSGPLARIQFSSLGTGSSPLTLSNLVFLDSNLADIALDATNNGSVNVTDGAVPEPATAIPVLLVLAAIAAARSRPT